MDKTIYVSVGHPNSKMHMLEMVAVTVPEESTEIAMAKILRKEVAENPEQFGFAKGIKFAPKDFFWAIFDLITDKTPRLHSDNYLWGVNGYEMRGKNPDGIDYYDLGYADAKKGQYNPPENEYCLSLYLAGQADYQASLDRLMGEQADRINQES